MNTFLPLANIFTLVAALVAVYCALEAGWNAGIAMGLAMGAWRKSDQYEQTGAPEELVVRSRESELKMKDATTKGRFLTARWARKQWIEWDKTVVDIIHSDKDVAGAGGRENPPDSQPTPPASVAK
jgi:hypothetical protein